MSTIAAELPTTAPAPGPDGPQSPLEQRAAAWINKLTFPRVLLALLVAAFAAGGAFAKAFVTRAELDSATAPLKGHTTDLASLRADVGALQALATAEAAERQEMRRQLYELAVKSGARVVIHLEPAELEPQPHPTGAGVDAGVPIDHRR